MSKRLEILEKSLEKKQARFDEYLQRHFDDVRSANGQPLNDKRDGQETMQRWERQEERLRDMEREIEKTKAAIEREKEKIARVETTSKELPEPILRRVAAGELIQWRKYPDTFFVPGVEGARMQWKNGALYYRYLNKVKDRAQFEAFRDAYNTLYRELRSDV